MELALRPVLDQIVAAVVRAHALEEVAQRHLGGQIDDGIHAASMAGVRSAAMGLDEALAALAIFPLPDVVLFPGTSIPLHVFEPRYVEMTRDVLGGSRHMAIVRLRSGFEREYHGRPPTYAIATAGEVVASRELPGDRFALVLRGTHRIAIERELPPARSFRQVAARVLHDHPADEDSLAEGREQLVVLCDRLATRIGEPGAGLRDLARSAETTPALTMILASALVREPDERQHLLEQRDPGARVARVVEHLSQLLVELGPGSSSLN